VVSSEIEHPAVLECLKQLAKQGLLRYTLVPVSREGLVVAADVEAALTPDTVLVSIMHSNNETGAVQPVAEVAAAARARRVAVHTDAAQSLGKVQARRRACVRGWRGAVRTARRAAAGLPQRVQRLPAWRAWSCLAGATAGAPRARQRANSPVLPWLLLWACRWTSRRWGWTC
jgi:hypothetical protein